jgi:putative DNA primase/helicase
LIFATNLLPPINDKSDGMWRRIIAMPFFVSFSGEQKDRNRAAQLREELPGIFNWAVVGLRRLHAQGDFTSCEVCQKCADDHRFDSDPFMQFVEDECVLDSGQQVQRRALLNVYRQWCEGNGRRPFSSSELFHRVADLDGVSERRPGNGNSRQRVWQGIGLQERMLGGGRS